MSDEHLRVLEHVFRASGDPADFGRWLTSAQRSGLTPDLGPLELAASCGSEAAALALGAERVPDAVVCLRSLCRALRSCRGRIGKRARGHLAAVLVRELEVAPAVAELRASIASELSGWAETGRGGDERQRRGWAALTASAQARGSVGVDEASRRVTRCLTYALWVMSSGHRRSGQSLERLLAEFAGGSWVASPEQLRRWRPQRRATLAFAKRSLEAWAFAEVAEGTAAGLQPI